MSFVFQSNGVASDEQIENVLKDVINKPNSPVASKNELKNKYDDVIIENNTLTFKADGVNKKLIKLPVNSGSGVIIRDTTEGEVFEIDTSDTIYGDIVISIDSLLVHENKTITFNVKLDKAPTNNQIVNLSLNNSNCTLDKTSLIFTSANYNVDQVVTITGIHDKSSLDNKTSTITLFSNKVGSKTINVTIANTDIEIETIPVTSVSFNETSKSIIVGSTLQLIATILPANATNKNVTWTSSDNNIATVTNGLVNTIAAGVVTITVVTVDGEKMATCNLTVKAEEKPTELAPSVRDGLTHMYDFTKLEATSTVIEDLIGNADVTITNEFARDGYLLYKGKHMRFGSALLEDNFTVFIHIKKSVGYYLFYCGDRSITNVSAKYNTKEVRFTNFELRDKRYYTLCIKFDSASKTIYTYVNGELMATNKNDINSSDKDIYTSFNHGSVTEEGENYNLLVYNRTLSDDEINTVSNEITVKKLDTKNVVDITNKNSLCEYYDFNNIQGTETSLNSMVGDNTLTVVGTVSANSGLILGTGSQYLESKYENPFNRYCTYFVSFTPPSSSTKGNKIVEFHNLALNISKTSCTLKIGTQTTTSFTPIQDKKKYCCFYTKHE